MAGNQGGRVLLNATGMWQRTFNDTGGVVAYFDEEIYLVVLAFVCGKVGVSAQSTCTRRRKRLFTLEKRGSGKLRCTPKGIVAHAFIGSLIGQREDVR